MEALYKLCKGKNPDFALIIKTILSNTPQLKENEGELVSFSLKSHNLMTSCEKGSNCRLLAGISHLNWLENVLYHLNNQNKEVELKDMLYYYNKLTYTESILDMCVKLLVESYLFRLEKNINVYKTNFEKLSSNLKTPSTINYNMLYLCWRCVEMAHSVIRDKKMLDRFLHHPMAIQLVTRNVEWIQIGLSWDKILGTNKFSAKEVDPNLGFLKRSNTTLMLLNPIKKNPQGVGNNVTTSTPVDGSAWYNLGLKSYNEKNFSQAILNFETALDLFKKTQDKEKMERTYGILARALYNDGKYQQSMTAAENSILCVDPRQDRVELYVEIYVKAKFKAKEMEKCLYSLHESFDLDTIGSLLKLELKALKSIENQTSESTAKHQLVVLNFLLELVHTGRTLDRVLAVLEKQRICCSIDYSTKTLEEAISNCDKCIQILGLNFPNELAICYTIKGLFSIHLDMLKARSILIDWKKYREYDNISELTNLIGQIVANQKFVPTLFLKSVQIWKELLSKSSSNTIDDVISDIDYSYELVNQISNTLLYIYGNHTLLQDSLQVLKLFDSHREGEENDSMDRQHQVDLENGLLPNLSTSNPILTAAIQCQSGNMQDSLSILNKTLQDCKSKDVLAICKYWMAQCQFYQNDPSCLESCLQSYSLLMKKYLKTSVMDTLKDKSSEEDAIEDVNTMDFTLMAKSLLQMAQIHESRGFLRETYFALFQGLYLSCLTLSIYWMSTFLNELATLERRRCRFGKSQEFGKVLQTIWSEQDLIDNSHSRLAYLYTMAETWRLIGNLSESQSCLNQMKEILNKITNKTLKFAQLESLMNQSCLDLSKMQGTKSDPVKFMETRNWKNLDAFNKLGLGRHYMMNGDMKKAHECFESSHQLSSMWFPQISKPSLISLGLLSQQEEIKSALYINASMNLSLRLKRIGLNKVGDVKSSDVLFHKEFDTLEWMIEFQMLLPSNMNVITLALSPDLNALCVTRINKTNVDVKKVSLLKSNKDIDKCMVKNEFEMPKIQTESTNVVWKREVMNTSKNLKMESTLLCTMNEFEDILDKNDENIKNVPTTKKHTNEWWKKRYALDERMKNLLLYMETIMLGDSIPPLMSDSTSHTVLILDKIIQRLPWENIPCLRYKSVSRMPSLLFLASHLTNASTNVDPSKTSYILNPSGDLKVTQKTFEPYFTEKKWNGMTSAPSSDQYKQALENNDVFIYMGHGAGEVYLKSSEIPQLKQCATTLLMGCSSGLLNDNGEYDSDGPVLNYMLGGCPCVVANLWDVTDVDIDRFSMDLLEKWMVGSVSLTQAANVARERCKLRFLIGCAPVCYGIPVLVQK